MSTAAPVTLSAANASSEAATSAEMPSADNTAQASTPALLPAIVASAVRTPPRSALRTIIAVPGPGVTVINAAIGRNAHSIAAMIRARACRTALGCGWPAMVVDARHHNATVLLRTEHAVARVLAEACDEASAYPRLLAAIGESLGWDAGALWVAPDGDGG